MVIQHNLLAMNANRQFGITNKKLKVSTEKLSSGYKINRSADDAAGLAISEKLRFRIRGLMRGSDNVTDGISMVQTGEGALGEVHDMLQRMNELTVQGLNGTLTNEDRSNVQDEIDQLYTEIGRVAESTTFNTIEVLKGDPLVTKHAPATGTLVKQTIVKKAPSMPTNFVTWNDRFTLGGANGATQSGNDGTSVKTIETTDANGNTVLTNVKNSSWSTTLDDNYGTFLNFAGLASTTGTTSVTNEDGSTSNVSNLYLALKEFVGTGFYTTCATCNEQYSVAFIDNERKYQFVGEPDYHGRNAATVYVNLNDFLERAKNATSQQDAESITKDFVKKIASQVSNNVYIKTHYTRYTTVDSDPYKLFIYDFRDDPTDPNDPRFGYVKQPDYGSNMGTVGNLQGYYTDYVEEQYLYDEDYITEEPVYIQYGDDGDNHSQFHLPDLMGIFDIYSAYGYNTVEDSLHLLTPIKSHAFENPTPASKGTYSTETYTIPAKTYKQPQYSTIYQNGEPKKIITGYTDVNIPEKTITVKKYNPAKVTAEDIAKEKEQSYGLNFGMLDVIDDLIGRVGKMRSYLGAIQNRLEHAYQNNQNIEENTTAAESRIRDTDMAEEMVAYSNNNILAQAGQSMLAQANQSQQGILSLLG